MELGLALRYDSQEHHDNNMVIQTGDILNIIKPYSKESQKKTSSAGSSPGEHHGINIKYPLYKGTIQQRAMVKESNLCSTNMLTEEVNIKSEELNTKKEEVELIEDKKAADRAL